MATVLGVGLLSLGVGAVWFLALAPRRWGGVGKDHWGF